MSPKGEILISRVYREDFMKSMVSGFKKYIVETKDIRSPIKIVNGASFLFIRTGKLYVVAITRSNVNASLVFEVLYKIVETFESYFKTVDEDTIRTNFSLIYELLDEILDYGYPQYCAREILQTIITQGKAKYGKDDGNGSNTLKVTKQITGAVPWRSPDLKYKKNQVFIDVIETVNVLVSSRGTVLSSDTAGKLVIKSELSGMPTCVIGMNDKAYMLAQDGKRNASSSSSSSSSARGRSGIAIDAFTFHQCVSLDKFDAERKISFIPPDGEFEVMKYRTTEGVSLPFRLHHSIQESGDHISIHLTVKSTFNAETFANMFKVRVPVPKNTAVCKVHVGAGKAKYLPDSNCILWKMWRFTGQSESTLAAEIELIHTTTKTPWSRPPISMDFEVPMFTSSGMQIKFMKVTEKSRYQAIKWGDRAHTHYY